LAYPADSLLVVQVTEFSASGDTDEVEKYEYSRDNQGFWYERRLRFRQDSLIADGVYKFDADRRTVSVHGSSREGGGELSHSSVEWGYDSQGRNSRITLRLGDTLTAYIAIFYDAAGNREKQVVTYEPPREPYSFFYGYDASGRLHSQKQMHGDTLLATEEYAYDAMGKVIKVALFDIAGDTTSIYTLEYDGAGRETRNVWRSASGLYVYSDVRTVYDAKGNVDSIKTYAGTGEIRSYKVHTYRTVSVPVPIRRPVAGRKAAHPAQTAFEPGRDALGRSLDAGLFAKARFPSNPGAPRN
jgi:hypothetical protein